MREASCLFLMNQTWKYTKDKYAPLLPTMSSVASFIWGVYLWRRKKSKRALMKLSMVFHSSATFLMNRFLWVKAKICVSFWRVKALRLCIWLLQWNLWEWRNLKCMSGDHLVIYGMVTMCIKIRSDTYVKVIPVDWLQGKCIVNPTTPCTWDSDRKVAAVEDFLGLSDYFAVRLIFSGFNSF